MTASKNTDSNIGAAVGSSLLNKLNLPGLSTGGGGPSVLASMQGLGKMGGYQPKMFGGKSTGSEIEAGNSSERSFPGRFGNAGSGVSASIDVPSRQFLGSSMQGKFGTSFNQQASGADSDTSSLRNNVYGTPGSRNPQSRKSVVEDDDIPNTDEFPGQ